MYIILSHLFIEAVKPSETFSLHQLLLLYVLLLVRPTFFTLCGTVSSTTISFFSSAAQGEERECAFMDQQQQWEVERMAGGEGRVSPENTTIRCAMGSHCFGLWEKSPPGEVRLVKQGTTHKNLWFIHVEGNCFWQQACRFCTCSLTC